MAESKDGVVFAVLKLQHKLPCCQCLQSYPPTSVTRPDDVEGPWSSEAPDEQPSGPGALQGPPPVLTKQPRVGEPPGVVVTRDTEGGCRGSRENSLPACGGWERNRNRMSGQVQKCHWHLSPSQTVGTCVTNKRQVRSAPLSNGQLSLALSVFPLRTLFIGVNAR